MEKYDLIIVGAGPAGIFTAVELLRHIGDDEMPDFTGLEVAVIGGGMVGCETAEYLAARGGKASVIEMMDKIAAGESTTILPTLLENYKTYGVEQYPSHKVKEFRMDAVVCENKDGAEVTIPCDYIVLAMGARYNEFDAAALEAAGIPVYSIGDAAGKAADISNAIRTGYDTACQLLGRLSCAQRIAKSASPEGLCAFRACFFTLSG